MSGKAGKKATGDRVRALLEAAQHPLANDPDHGLAGGDPDAVPDAFDHAMDQTPDPAFDAADSEPPFGGFDDDSGEAAPDLSFTWDDPEPKTEPALPSQTPWHQWEIAYMPKFDTRCRVCKINIGAGPMGYVCTRDDCPTTARVR